MVENEIYKARRAFQVEEYADEGSHYFLELEDGRVMHCSGQLFYDYEPNPECDSGVQLRRFPCTEFTVRRHSESKHFLGLICEATVLEPDLVLPPFLRGYYAWSDGEFQMVPEGSYDQVRNELTAPR